MVIKPFRGLRPCQELASRIPSPPYDVLDSTEARAQAAGDPYTFLHVEKPEIDLDPTVDLYDDRVYATGRDNLRAMVEQGWLVQDEKPAYYVYRLVAGGHTQTGIAGVAAIDDHLTDKIKKHEHTRPDKENDRTRHIDALSANSGPILMAYRGVPELNAVVNGITERQPAVDFVAADGIAHALWVVDDPTLCGQIQSLFARIPSTYVADGHHRAAAAARVGRQRRDANPSHTGEEAYNSFLAVHFPAHQLEILGYHRLVRDLNGLDPGAFLDRVTRADFEIRERHRNKRPPRKGTFGMYLAQEGWFLLLSGPEISPSTDPVGAFDVSVLSGHILEPILGIGDPRTDRRVDFVGGGKPIEEIERRVNEGEAAVAFILHPPSVDDVMRVADAGRVMPPKSTWFEPKLRSGMVVHLL